MTFKGFQAGWCPPFNSIPVVPTSQTTTSGAFDWTAWAKEKLAEQPKLEEAPLVLLIETDCPVCRNPPTVLNEAQDRCERDGRLTCYRCGWKGPA